MRDTRVVEFETEFIAAMQAAVTPSEADVLVARGVVMDAITGSVEPVRLTDFEDRLLRALGAHRPAERTSFTAILANEPGRRFADPDRNDAHLVEFRGRHSVRRAVAQLIAEGVIARGDGNQYEVQPEYIPVQYPGGGSGAPVMVHSARIGEQGSTPRFLAVRPADGKNSEALLPMEELLFGLDDILGSRGIRLVRESRRALQRGLYLASSSLLAAASEAAWFNLARAVPSPPPALSKKVDEGRDIAEVIRLTDQSLKALKPSLGSATITEVVAQAQMFRDVRNYALHPVDPHDGDRETWLTETGATLLAIASRRYFVKLADMLKRLRTASKLVDEAPPRIRTDPGDDREHDPRSVST